MHIDTIKYNDKQVDTDSDICKLLASTISSTLPDAESRFWHGHPVWFLDGNPIVGYGKLKDCVRLLFWSGQSFHSTGLAQIGIFKAAEKRYVSIDEIDIKLIKLWLAESRITQWDYKNIVKRKGRLEKLYQCINLTKYPASKTGNKHLKWFLVNVILVLYLYTYFYLPY